MLYGNMKLVKDGDSGKMVAPRPQWTANAHAGPIVSLVRSPICPDLVLSVGGWSFAIWKEDEDKEIAKEPLLMVSSNDKVRILIYYNLILHRCVLKHGPINFIGASWVKTKFMSNTNFEICIF